VFINIRHSCIQPLYQSYRPIGQANSAKELNDPKSLNIDFFFDTDMLVV